MITWDRATPEGLAFILADELYGKGTISLADRAALQKVCELVSASLEATPRARDAGESFEDPIEISCKRVAYVDFKDDGALVDLWFAGTVDGRVLHFHATDVASPYLEEHRRQTGGRRVYLGDGVKPPRADPPSSLKNSCVEDFAAMLATFDIHVADRLSANLRRFAAFSHAHANLVGAVAAAVSRGGCP